MVNPEQKGFYDETVIYGGADLSAIFEHGTPPDDETGDSEAHQDGVAGTDHAHSPEGATDNDASLPDGDMPVIGTPFFAG